MKPADRNILKILVKGCFYSFCFTFFRNIKKCRLICGLDALQGFEIFFANFPPHPTPLKKFTRTQIKQMLLSKKLLSRMSFFPQFFLCPLQFFLLEKICFLVRKKFLTFTECFFALLKYWLFRWRLFFALKWRKTTSESLKKQTMTLSHLECFLKN